MTTLTLERDQKHFVWTKEMLDDIENSVLCWVATVSADGTPNVSPKEMFCAHNEDVMLIANIASPMTKRNLLVHPAICISFVDVFRQCGFKLQGQAQVIASNTAQFAAIAQPLLTMVGADFKIQDIFYVRVSKAARILAPSYRLFPERSVEEHMARTYRTYGVEPESR